jgi:uroporphyrinogen decarboxylase
MVDLRLAKERIGEQVCLIGNVDPLAVMLQGSAATVEYSARACIAAAWDGGGYILGTGCEVPPGLPLENVQALVRMAALPDG